MIQEYYHFVISSGEVVNTDPYLDANGNWVIPDDAPPPVELKQPCRAEANSQGQKVPSKDGENIDFSWLIYMPVSSKEVPYNADVKITDTKGNIVGTGTVKRFKRASMNAMLWV